VTSCLVTGGAGAIGSNLTSALLAAGHQVTVIDDLSSGHRDLVPAGARMIAGSIEEDDALAEAFAGRPAWVLHLAALFANQNSVEHPERDLLVNGLGTLKLLERATTCGATKLLYTSSSCVYGHKAVMREDDVNLECDTPYAITKLLGEQYCRFWSRHHGLDTVIVRIFNTYGPHEYPGRYRNVIPNFIKLAMEGQALPITGTGNETRDFNFVSDTVAGIMAAIAAPTPPGEVYNLASGNETSIVDLAQQINLVTGNRAGVVHLPRRGWDHVVTRRGDATKARSAFGHVAKISLPDGIARTYEWLKSLNG
jgi:UDP-glucose 4-epimerase